MLYFTEPPSSLSIENVTPENRLLGTEGHDLTVSCEAIGGTPPPNVVLIIDGDNVASQTQTVQHTLHTTRSYNKKRVICKASHANYSHISLTESAVIFLNCK